MVEHHQLSYLLYKKYMIILLVSIAIFVLALISINHLFQLKDNEYTVYPPNLHATMSNIIRETEIVGNNIVAVVEQQSAFGGVSSTGNYCNSTLTYEQCYTLMNQNQANRIIMEERGITTSFRCILGDCSAFAHLSDYFWTYKLRFTFIEYMKITYNSNSTFLVPSLAVQTVSSSALPYLSGWSLTYTNSTLVLSLRYTGQISIDIALVLDRVVLQAKYGLDLTQFDFGQVNYPINVKQTHYQMENVVYLLVEIILLIVSCVILAFRVKNLINQWARISFTNLEALDSLYRYQLDCIFTGQQPDNSAILSQSAMSNFYEELSDLIDRSYKSLSVRKIEPEKEEPFKFVPLLERVAEKYEIQMKKQQEDRNKELADLKYQIKGAVSEIVENVARKLKDSHSKAKQLRINSVFFYYAYLSLLEPTARYESRLRQSQSPLPESVIALFRYMNNTIHSDNIKFPFKFAGIFTKTIEEELTMKLQFHLQQKYLSQLKQLDFGLVYGKKLGLQKEIKYLQESIDNRKYIFTTYLK